MNEKDTTISLKRLSSDEAYFTSVFKKTEKITSVIFYILSHTHKSQKDSIHLKRLEDKTVTVHEIALASLQYQTAEAEERLTPYQYELMALDSTLRVAQAAGVISEEVLQLLLEQIDSVQRFINNHYTKDTGVSLDIAEAAALPSNQKSKPAATQSSTAPTKRRQRVQIPAGDISTDAYLVYSQMTDRAERIKTVLEAKPEASVKDISVVITDVIEMTIQ